MQRRDFLSGLTAISKTPKQETVMPPAGLEKYSGTWTNSEAAHLLRRTTFGPTYQTITQFTSLGLDNAIDKLFDIKPLAATDVPINYDYEADVKVPIGSTWIDKAGDVNAQNYRFRSLFGWTMSRILTNEVNLREKMTLFWHNHFVIADMNDARYYYKYINIFRPNPVGNFKNFTIAITTDPAMLRYLNGNQNTKKAPNENYARELLELFTIGKGPIAGPGDYTNYTESDIIAIAKVLTGWVDIGNRNPNIDVISSIFRPANHDTSVKTLSNRFGNASISNADDQEYIKLIDIIFKQEEVSKFIARKLYRWFVFYDIDATVESEVITPMAKLIRDNNYDIKPALKALLSSAHFFSNIGCMIKNPIDFALGCMNQFKLQIVGTDIQKYTLWNSITQYTGMLQMRYFDAPNVAGWKAYYQEPGYYNTWLNSVTMPLRTALTDGMVSPTLFVRGIRVDFDLLTLVKEFSNPADLESLIQDAALLLLPKPLSANQLATLKEITNTGLPDYEWTIEYQAYINKPTDTALKKAVENKLRALFTYMMRMPEYQLS